MSEQELKPEVDALWSVSGKTEEDEQVTISGNFLKSDSHEQRKAKIFAAGDLIGERRKDLGDKMLAIMNRKLEQAELAEKD